MRNLAYQCIHEKEVPREKITRPGSSGYVNIRKVFDPDTNLTHRAILAIHARFVHSSLWVIFLLVCKEHSRQFFLPP